jgi:hypothetical protein
VSDQVSHPYQTGKILVVYLSLHFCLANWKTKDSAPKDNKMHATRKHNAQVKNEDIISVGVALGCIFQTFHPNMEGFSILFR